MEKLGRRRGARLSQIARAVGVTEGTASRALNGYADISEDTRRKVLEAAAELNYRPSSTARRLARGSVETIGYVLPRHARTHTDPFLSEMLEGISQALASRDWDLLVTSLDESDDEIETYKRLVDSGKVSGMIVTRTLSDDPRISYLRAAGVPFVSHGRTIDADDYAWIDADNRKAAVDAVAHLADLGHRKIAMICASPLYNFNRLRVDGYRESLVERGLPTPAEYLVEAELSAEGGHRAALQLLDLEDRPTGIICITDLVAIGAMRAAREREFAVGRDVSVIGYDGLPFSAFTDPPLTTMTQDVIRTGKQATEILLKIIDGAEPTGFQEIWHARLVRRASDGPPV